jgi:hypothetical protein
MGSVSSIILVFGLSLLSVGLIGGFSPWAYELWIYLVPAENYGYKDDLKGGPYPELFFLFLLAPAGLLIVLLGGLLKPQK